MNDYGRYVKSYVVYSLVDSNGVTEYKKYAINAYTEKEDWKITDKKAIAYAKKHGYVTVKRG